MNIEEARKVIWFENYPKPMGELLDEGYLFESRLRWAAEKAYVPQIKEAANAILEWQKSSSNSTTQENKLKTVPAALSDESMPIRIALEEARSTLWPFTRYKGQPMGALVDAQQLSLRDLAYAIENAWDERVRQAAIALSLIKLGQVVKEPVSGAGPTRVVSGGRSYSARKESQLTLIQGMILGSIFSLLVAVSIWMVIAGHKPNPGAKSFTEIVSTPAGVAALIFTAAFFIFLGWLVNFIPEQISKSLDKKIEEYRLGQEGEDQVVQSIIQSLDGNWHLFRNVKLPGKSKSDLDLILVGPSGIWALEVKNFNGFYRNIGDRWEYLKNKQWRSLSKSPSQQARREAGNLAGFLRADKINAYVNGVVVWANPESPLTVDNPSTTIWLYNDLPNELGNIWQGEKLSTQECERINNKLAKLCDAQKEEQQR